MFSRLTRHTGSELVVVVSLDKTGYSFERERRIPYRGLVTDLGFAEGPDLPITIRQPKDNQRTDWVLFDRLSMHEEGRRLRNFSVNLRERLAYDLYLRSEIAWTGIQITVGLPPSSLETYLTYLGNLDLAPRPNVISSNEWSSVIFRFVTRKFTIPMRRGGHGPTFDERRIGKLRKVREFNCKRLKIQKIETLDGQPQNAVDGLPVNPEINVPGIIIVY